MALSCVVSAGVCVRKIVIINEEIQFITVYFKENLVAVQALW